MNLLIYSHTFAPSVGGVESFVMTLARGLVASANSQGLTVTVVTQTRADELGDGSLPFRVVRCPNARMLWRLVGQADVVHLAGPALLPLLLGLVRRKAVVVEHHGFQAVCPNGQLFHEPSRMQCRGHFVARRYHECLRCNARRGAVRALSMCLLTFPRRWLCQQVSVNIAPTAWLARVLKRRNTTVIYHSVKTSGSGVSLQSARSKTFAFIGRLVSAKGVNVLLLAIRRLRTQGVAVRLKVVGIGPEREALQALAASLGLSDCVVFKGYVPEDALDGVLGDVAAVVVPSLAGEVFGLVAAEHMMRGRVVIASEVGGLGEVVGDAGLKFGPGDVDGLAERLRAAVEAPDLATELGSKARQRALALFNEERVISGHLAVYAWARSRNGRGWDKQDSDEWGS